MPSLIERCPRPFSCFNIESNRYLAEAALAFPAADSRRSLSETTDRQGFGAFPLLRRLDAGSDRDLSGPHEKLLQPVRNRWSVDNNA